MTLADGHVERVATLRMIAPRAKRPRAITLGADKGYSYASKASYRSQNPGLLVH
jgi:hypothetical protein